MATQTCTKGEIKMANAPKCPKCGFVSHMASWMAKQLHMYAKNAVVYLR